MMKQRVPVLMYHSVGIPDKRWHWNYLTCPYQVFENQLQWLMKNKYRTIYLDELYGYIFENRTIPKKAIILTFDDGYLDNWVFAYPLLKKYGFTGTIFVNPDFVDSRTIKRLRIDETDGDIGKLEATGFLSWEEMKEMEKDGTIDIQSHAMSHTHYPISDQIIDFRNPNDTYIWLSWNKNIKEKPYMQIDDTKYQSWGEPVYEMDSSLKCKRYFPDEGLENHIIDYVKANGKDLFFRQNNWKEKLLKEVTQYKTINGTGGVFESQEQFEKRNFLELSNSKNILSENLNKTINFLCWPEGGASKEGVKIADLIGYKMSTAARDIPKTRKIIPNSPLMKTRRIKRFSPVLYWNGIEGFEGKTAYMNGFELRLKILAFKNIFFSKYWANLFLLAIKMVKIKK